MMKNLLNISALLCAAALITGCSNEEMMENGASAGDVTLVATTGASTKTSVDGNYNVNWTAKDAFYVFGDKGSGNNYSSKGTFTWTSGTTTSGKFNGTVTGKMSKLQYAVYPADKYDSKTMKVTFPTQYTYPNSNAPMFGKLSADKQTVVFDQLLSGMMRVTVNNLPQGTSGSLKLEGTDITGSAKLTIGADGQASLSEWSDKASSITLKFANASDPLVLDIPLPEGTYASGITATLTIDEASAEAFKTETGFAVTAGKIMEMPEINIAEITSTTISFVKEVADVTEAIDALKAGSKNVTINTVEKDAEITIPASSTADAPVTININTVGENFTVKGAEGTTTAVVKVNVPEGSTGTVNVENIERLEINGNWTVANTKAVTNNNTLVVKAGTGVKELIVTDIDHIEIGGTWEKVTSSTNENTLVMQADAVVKDLTVNEGNIKIEQGAEVQKLTLNTDVTINNSFDISEDKSMEILLGTHTLTLPIREGVENFIHIYKGASLMITGDAIGKGKVIDKTRGISLANSNTNLTMTNVDYSADNKNADGILLNYHGSNMAVKIENCTMKSVEYCLNTNASAPVGSDNTITLINSTFIASETALMVNIPATLTATGCTFTGGWQGAFLRGGTFTFDGCNFNLNVDDTYGTSKVATGAASWGSGNNAPAAAITAGNRSSSAYDYKTHITLANSCAFAVQVNGTDSKEYPAIYLDAEQNKPNQGVAFIDSEATYTTPLAEVGKGLVINNTTGQVTVNGTAYTGTVAE